MLPKVIPVEDGEPVLWFTRYQGTPIRKLPMEFLRFLYEAAFKEQQFFLGFYKKRLAEGEPAIEVYNPYMEKV